MPRRTQVMVPAGADVAPASLLSYGGVAERKIVTALWPGEAEVAHHHLPLATVWWHLAVTPVSDHVRHLVGDRLMQKGLGLHLGQREVVAYAWAAARPPDHLSGTPSGEIKTQLYARRYPTGGPQQWCRLCQALLRCSGELGRQFAVGRSGIGRGVPCSVAHGLVVSDCP